ncbi:MAG: hypothetical protein ACBZ72_08365 [Candidatus Bathyarchaeia archaeon]
MSNRPSMVTLGLVLTGIVLLLSTSTCVEAASATWSQTYGGPYPDKAYAMVKTSDGGYVLTGTTNSFGSGIVNAWLVKTDTDGVMQWNQTYSGLEQGISDTLTQTSDGGYALGGYTYSIDEGGIYAWLVKTDAEGNLSWNSTYGELGTAIAYGITQTSDGGYALVGASNTIGAGQSDGWLAKISSTGELEWYQTYGADQNDAVYSVVQTSDGGYALAGDSDSYGSGQANLWLIKTDSSGAVQWNQTYGGANNYISSTLIPTSDGGFALAGTVQIGNANRFVLFKTDSSGEEQWTQTYSGTVTSDNLNGIQTSDGGYALVGVTDSADPAQTKALLVKTDSSGVQQWNQTIGESGQNVLGAVVQNSDGTYTLGGYTNATGSGQGDFWLVKTDANGAVTLPTTTPTPTPTIAPTATNSPSPSPSPQPEEGFPTWMNILIFVVVFLVVAAVIGFVLQRRRK